MSDQLVLEQCAEVNQRLDELMADTMLQDLHRKGIELHVKLKKTYDTVDRDTLSKETLLTLKTTTSRVLRDIFNINPDDYVHKNDVGQN